MSLSEDVSAEKDVPAVSAVFAGLSIAGAVTFCNIVLALLSSLPAACCNGPVLSLDASVPHQSMAGLLLGPMGLFLLAVFYVLNFHQWPTVLGKILATAIAWVMFFIAAIFKGWSFPWAPTVCVLLLMTFMLLAIRSKWRRIKAYNFAFMVGVTFLIWGVTMITLWSLLVACDADNSLQELRKRTDAREVYKYFGVQFYSSSNGTNHHCRMKEDEEVHMKEIAANGTKEVHMTERQVQIPALCAKANNVILLTWAQPLIAGLVDLGSSIFFLFSFYFIRYHNGSDTKVSVQGGTLVAILTILIGGLYVATYFSEISVNVTIPLLVVLFVGGVAGCAWLFVELESKLEVKEAVVKEDRPVDARGQIFDDVKDSPWIQAMAVGSGFIPTFMVLERARQYVCTKEGNKDGPWTLAKQRLLEAIEKWKWSEILIKICILGEVFFTLQVLGTKVTYVFLAWLNSKIGDAGLGPVIGIAFSVGFLMFMLPPVPGVPVYIFCGIVVSLQGTDDIGFWGVCFLAIFLSLTLKLSACTGQYYIGYKLGHNPRVLHFIGVGTPVTTAIRQILDGPNVCDVRRVFVLVGGPDWPTSVTCGILKVNLRNMLLGTLPCLLTASPCVLAGVFLADVKDGKESNSWHKGAGSAATVIAGIVQMGSMLLATTTIWQKVHEQQDEQDTYPIPEKVKELRAKEETYNDRFKKIQEEDQGKFWCVLFPAASLILMTGYSFAGFQSLLFENFSVSGNINDPTDSFGLGGKPWYIVKWPLGWAAICVFLVGVGLHVMFFVLVRHTALRQLESEQKHEISSEQETAPLVPRR